ncbi:MAG: peptide-methionine (S)-S-oxide reductase, partial [Selenomonas sp.]|nr:peptide-methionine (S)-S-oxide reductase [Selenomonas sp.]
MQKRICLSGADMYELEEVFRGRRGIVSVRTGYINAAPQTAHEDALTGASGGRVGVEIVYDPKKTDISQLLDLHFSVVTPYSIDGQGYVRGAVYRAGIFYESAEDEPQIALYLTFLAGKGRC